MKPADSLKGIMALSEALKVTSSMRWLDVSYTSLGEGEAALRKAIEGRSGFELGTTRTRAGLTVESRDSASWPGSAEFSFCM